MQSENKLKKDLINDIWNIYSHSVLIPFIQIYIFISMMNLQLGIYQRWLTHPTMLGYAMATSVLANNSRPEISYVQDLVEFVDDTICSWYISVDDNCILHTQHTCLQRID